MGTVDLLAMINEAAALGLSLNTDNDKLNVTGPKTPEAAALVQRLAQHKAAVIDLVSAPDPESLPPMLIVTDQPPLPAELWLNGLTPAEAMAKWRELKRAYFCTCGADAAGWFVRCDPAHYEVGIDLQFVTSQSATQHSFSCGGVMCETDDTGEYGGSGA